MKRLNAIILITLITHLISTATLASAEKAKESYPLLKINKELDKRTEVKKSLIPNGGNGLYARVPIKKGEVIGELGGRLLPADKYPQGNHYIAALLECAQKRAHRPYRLRPQLPRQGEPYSLTDP